MREDIVTEETIKKQGRESGRNMPGQVGVYFLHQIKKFQGAKINTINGIGLKR
jgi:hypothetical protein